MEPLSILALQDRVRVSPSLFARAGSVCVPGGFAEVALVAGRNALLGRMAEPGERINWDGVSQGVNEAKGAFEQFASGKHTVDFSLSDFTFKEAVAAHQGVRHVPEMSLSPWCLYLWGLLGVRLCCCGYHFCTLATATS